MSSRGIPSADELAQALHEFLAGEVVGQTGGPLRFHARVAANVAAILERELRLGQAHAAAHAERLGALGMADDGELAAAIRSGALDARLDELRDVLLADTIEQLGIDNPRHLEPRHAE